MMSYFFCIWGFARNKSLVGLRSGDLPTRGVTPTKGAMLTKGAVCSSSSTCRSSCTLDDHLDHILLGMPIFSAIFFIFRGLK